MMKRFYYQGLGAGGRRLRGQLMAADERDAVEQLKSRGCQVTRLKALRTLPSVGRRRLTAGELAPLCQQLGMLLSSGVSLLRCLLMMRDDQHDKRAKLWLDGLLTQIEGGQTLTKALTNSAYQAPPVLLELVAVGERNGRLDEVLQQAAAYFERQRKWQSELAAALLYPALVLLVMVLAVGAMLIFVVPQLVTTYQSLDAPIPLLTRGVIAVSGFLRQAGGWLALALLAAVLLLALAGSRARASQSWRQLCQGLLDRLPGLKRYWAEQYYVQFAQTLGQLLAGGVLLIDGLALVREHYHGIVFADDLQALYTSALEGRSLTEGFQGAAFVPQAALPMIHAGEEAAQLDAMLLASGAYYGQRLNGRLTRLVKILEPLLIILLGLLVLLIAASLFLPIISSYRYIG